jgi:uncharacterized OsmC-like protein
MSKSDKPVMAKVVYQGNLRCEATHLRSGKVIVSDAPVDNNGKGEAFSPTDLLATSLAKCIITIMGIRANKMDKDLGTTEAEVVKIMASDPRRVAEVHIDITLDGSNFSDTERTILEKAGRACPVAQSLSQDLVQKVEFHWR